MLDITDSRLVTASLLSGDAEDLAGKRWRLGMERLERDLQALKLRGDLPTRSLPYAQMVSLLRDVGLARRAHAPSKEAIRDLSERAARLATALHP